MIKLRGVTTLTNAVSGQSQNCSGNLEISPGIGTLGIFSGKHAIIPGHCKQNRDIEGNLFHLSQKFGRMIQIYGTTYCAFQYHGNSKIQRSTDKCVFHCRQSTMQRLLPAYDYCRTWLRCLNSAQRFGYRISTAHDFRVINGRK